MLHTRLCAARCTRVCRPPSSQPLLLPSLTRSYSDVNAPSGSGLDIAVLGGGISGLATAYFLTREHPTAKITVYERQPRVGGWLHSTRKDVKDGSVLFEAGPRTLRPQSNGVLTARLVCPLLPPKHTCTTLTRTVAAGTRSGQGCHLHSEDLPRGS